MNNEYYDLIFMAYFLVVILFAPYDFLRIGFGNGKLINKTRDFRLRSDDEVC